MDAFSGLQEPRRFFADVHRIVIAIPVSSGFDHVKVRPQLNAVIFAPANHLIKLVRLGCKV